MIRKAFFLLVLASVLLLSSNTKAGTLNWGVSISSFHVAGGTPNGNPALEQLKYMIAVDHKIGIKNRYKVEQITNTYEFSTYNFSSDTYDYSTTYDDDSYMYDYAYNTKYEKGSSHTEVGINASFTGDKNELSVSTINN